MTTIGPLKNREGTLITEEPAMAEELNKFFASVFTQENIETVPALEPETASQFNNIEITEEKIRIKIKQLKENGAPGPDEIRAKIL